MIPFFKLLPLRGLLVVFLFFFSLFLKPATLCQLEAATFAELAASSCKALGFCWGRHISEPQRP